MGVHRLVDMVVEEVSLVDRPANKQRFLIVKRDEQMAKAKDDKAPPPKGKGPKDKPGTKPEPDDPFEGEEDEEETGGGGGGGGGEPPKPPAKDDKGKKPAKKADDGSLLSAALSALEGLTEAVELLATSGDEAGAQLGELAEELDELADRLAQAAGVTPPDTGEGGEDPGGFAPGVGDGAVGKALAAVRDTIKRVRAVVAAAERATKNEPAAPAPGVSQGGTAPVGAPAAPVNKVEEALVGLRDEMRGLREAVQGQGQRLVTLEKGIGLPNSARPGDRLPPARGEDDDDSWPLDMNRPRDRQSVDKSVSFHERD
jgi:hypothetical protein